MMRCLGLNMEASLCRGRPIRVSSQCCTFFFFLPTVDSRAMAIIKQGPRSHLAAIFVVEQSDRWFNTREGKRMDSARHTEKTVYQDSVPSSVAPKVLRTSRGADAPAFVALRAPFSRLNGYLDSGLDWTGLMQQQDITPDPTNRTLLCLPWREKTNGDHGPDKS